MSRAKPETSEQAIATANLAAAGAIDVKHPFVDPETAKAYNEYLADWRWNMATHRMLQREYMGSRGYMSGSGGEHY